MSTLQGVVAASTRVPITRGQEELSLSRTPRLSGLPQDEDCVTSHVLAAYCFVRTGFEPLPHGSHAPSCLPKSRRKVCPSCGRSGSLGTDWEAGAEQPTMGSQSQGTGFATPLLVPHRRARKGLYLLSRSFPRGRRPQGGRQGRHYQNPHLFKASAPSCPLGLPVEQEASVQPPECGPVSSALWPQGTGRLSCPFLPRLSSTGRVLQRVLSSGWTDCR